MYNIFYRILSTSSKVAPRNGGYVSIIIIIITPIQTHTHTNRQIHMRITSIYIYTFYNTSRNYKNHGHVGGCYHDNGNDVI